MPGRYIDDVIIEKEKELGHLRDQSMRIMGHAQYLDLREKIRAAHRELEELEWKRDGRGKYQYLRRDE
jgi:hypothetical protein